MRRLFSIAYCIIFYSALSAQDKPKLVVGIVVDQMRQEYLYRFSDKFGEDGFKKLMNQGYMFKNTHYNYIPTFTAPGHTSIYTGTTPAVHGIIGNNWYDKDLQKTIYCAEDNSEQTVGSTSESGQMSPRRMLTSTISDELRLSNQLKSKVIGLSIKDRGAIYPAGHSGEAYWYDKKTGDFITSTYYRKDLPDWVKSFNAQKRADDYLQMSWQLANDEKSYTGSGEDLVPYERSALKDKPVFPYALKPGAYWMVPETAFGNDILTDVTIAAIKEGGMGTDEYTDLLAVSFSSTDYIGHSFGPNSKELEDTYIRLDKNIAQIIKTLDERIGKGEYTLFLTADHAMAEVPAYLIDRKVPAGNFPPDRVAKLNEELIAQYGEGKWVENMSNNQVFLNHELISDTNKSLKKIQEYVAGWLLTREGISNAYSAYTINAMNYDAGGLKGALARGYNQKRSGDVLVAFEPGWIGGGSTTGSTHGSHYTYDTHVPMLWYGKNIKAGKSVRYHTITDLAPTLSMMLDVKLPNGATGQPLEELFGN